MKKDIFYFDGCACLINKDSFLFLETMHAGSVDMIFADPPYFLSNGGISSSGGRIVSVDKGAWDKVDNFEEKHEFNRKWIKLAKRVLKKNGTIWVTGTFHNIYSVGVALEQEGFKIMNNITWYKTNSGDNLTHKYFKYTTETILWARKKESHAEHYFNYELMTELNGGLQMEDVWSGPHTAYKEKRFGKHPTQKPEYLLERIILASTKPGDLILDPFVGSGTTCVIAKRLGRKSIGVDKGGEYLAISRRRLIDLDDTVE